jgi:uncharacterized protein (TIGR02145 family)
MKKLFTLLVIIAMTISVFGQSPQKMSYQAVVRNSSGNLVTNTPVGIRIQILQTSEFGAAVYVETHLKTTNVNGLVTLEIGDGTVVLGTFSGINWANGPYYIKVETDITGGTNYSISGVSQILSVPYALHSKTVASYSETDPVFVASPANGISSTNINNWATAYSWGNHASAGYITGTRILTINGTALNLSSDRSWSVGTVTSVGLTLPGIFSVSGSPVTASGTLSASLASQTANTLFASPNGSAGTPAFRSLVAADIPGLDWSKITSGKPTTLSGYGITDAVNTTGNQTIGGNKTFTGTTTVPTPVNATDAATKAYVDVLLDRIADLETLTAKVQDADGNLYSVLKIGTQYWLDENLKTTKCNDGTPIPIVTDNTTWSGLTSRGYCWYYNQDIYINIFGALYNWYTVQTGKLCPTGWHVPTDAEWTILTDYLGGLTIAGGKLKNTVTGSPNWGSPNTGATNESGFAAPPGGRRNSDGTWSGGALNGYWWSSTAYAVVFPVIDAWYRRMDYDNSGVYRDVYPKKCGFSVRCIKD